MKDSDELLRTLENGHSSYVNSICITKNGENMISGGYDNLVIVWDLKKGEVIHKLGGHSKHVM